jgi:hypothetical protein
MQKKLAVFFALFLSLFLHLAAVFSCSLQIKAKGSPSFYGWINIISRKDLFLEDKEVIFPSGVDFSSDYIRRRYFSSLPRQKLYFSEDEKENEPALAIPEISESFSSWEGLKRRNGHFYLWQRPAVFSPWEEEAVSYNAYVSPYGKILFLYPDKLPVNSYGNLHLQEYLRKASFFLDRRFFWTKLEGVVK